MKFINKYVDYIKLNYFFKKSELKIAMVYSFNINNLPKINSIYAVERKTVWKIADRHNIFIIILDGKCCIEIDGKNYTLQKGDNFFIPAEYTYTRKPIDDEICKILYIHFDVEELKYWDTESELENEIIRLRRIIDNSLIDNSYEVMLQNHTVYLKQHNSINSAFEDITNYINSALNYQTKNSLERNMITTLNVCNIFALITKITLRELLNQKDLLIIQETPNKLKKAILYIHQNHSHKITLSDLCNFCHVSKQQMIRYFKEYLNATPTTYIIEYKLDKAKEYLLNSSHLSIKEICNELGFDDQHYFSRIFKKFNNETPKEYRYRVTNFNEANQ